jgi:hypothetical protein
MSLVVTTFICFRVFCNFYFVCFCVILSPCSIVVVYFLNGDFSFGSCLLILFAVVCLLVNALDSAFFGVGFVVALLEKTPKSLLGPFAYSPL